MINSQLELTTHILRNTKVYTDEKIKTDKLDKDYVLVERDKTILVAMSTWVNMEHNKSVGKNPLHVWVTIDTLVEMTGFSHRSVQSAITKLQDIGYLVQTKKGRSGRASEYDIVLKSVDMKPKPVFQPKPTVVQKHVEIEEDWTPF